MIRIQKNLIEAILVQIVGEQKISEDIIRPIGLFNFPQPLDKGMPGALVRLLKKLVLGLNFHYSEIKEEQSRLNTIKNENSRADELAILFNEYLVIEGMQPIPLSLLEQIRWSEFINSEWLIDIGLVHDDTVPILFTNNKKNNTFNLIK